MILLLFFKQNCMLWCGSLGGVILLETCTSTIDIFCKLRAGGGGFGQGPKGKVFFLGEGHSFLKGGE